MVRLYAPNNKKKSPLGLFFMAGTTRLSWLVRVERVYSFCFKEFHSFRKSTSHSARSSLELNNSFSLLPFPWHKKRRCKHLLFKWRERRGSNSRPHAWQACALTNWATLPFDWLLFYTNPNIFFLQHVFYLLLITDYIHQ